MAASPCFLGCANTRGAAAIAVTAAPVVRMVRLIESIIGASRIIVAASLLAGMCGSRRRRSDRGVISNLVLRHGVEIAGVMALMQLAGGIAPGAVDHAAA